MQLGFHVDERARKDYLRGAIKSMNEVDLQCLSALIMCSTTQMLRKAMVFMVELLSREELQCWEEATTSRMDEPPCKQHRQSCIDSGSRVAGCSTSSSSQAQRSQSLQSDFPSPEEQTKESELTGVFKDDLYENESEADNTSEGSRGEVHTSSINAASEPLGRPTSSSSQILSQNLLGDFPVPEEDTVEAEQSGAFENDYYEDQAKAKPRQCAASVDLDMHGLLSQDADPAEEVWESVTNGRWLALKQEMKMKDFRNDQMGRQIDFERHRTAWLESERSWREDRERRMDVLAYEAQPQHIDEPICTRTMRTDEIWRGQSPTDNRAESREHGYQAIDVFFGEDVSLESSYMRNSQAFWDVEANSMRSHEDDMLAQSEQDQVYMSTAERQEYENSLDNAFETMRAGFEEQRTEAHKNANQVVQDLSKHHDKVRWRHLQNMMSEHEEDEDIQWSESGEVKMNVSQA